MAHTTWVRDGNECGYHLVAASALRDVGSGPADVGISQLVHELLHASAQDALLVQLVRLLRVQVVVVIIVEEGGIAGEAAQDAAGLRVGRRGREAGAVACTSSGVAVGWNIVAIWCHEFLVLTIEPLVVDRIGHCCCGCLGAAEQVGIHVEFGSLYVGWYLEVWCRRV